MRFRSLVFLLTFCAATPASAQQPADSLCTYDTCALRVEQSAFSVRIVRGAEGVPVARFGLFQTDLSDIVASSERAVEHARIYDRTRTPAALTAFGTGLLLAFAATDEEVISMSDGVRLGTLLGGIGLGVISIRLGVRSQRAFSRAVWWYNRDLPR